MAKLLYAIAAYALFLGSMLWGVAFVGNFVAPKTIDRGGEIDSTMLALVVDLGLVLLFSTQHSVMARPGFKKQWTKWVPTSIERATYVLAATIALVLLLGLWKPIPKVVWNVDSAIIRLVLWVAFAVGWVIVISSTFLIDHLHLFGLKQAYRSMRGELEREPTFRKVLLYKLVRHPLMLGFLVVFWVIPTMTVGHLVFAAGMTAYILVGIHLEERDLKATLGAPYEAYRQEVRMLLPIPKGSSKSASEPKKARS